MNSFDLFDTLITRDVYQPSDIFYFVGKTARELGLLNIRESEFKNIRVEAEMNARKKSQFEEITLDEIYHEISKLIKIDNVSLARIKELEIEIERKSLFIIEENKRYFTEDSIIITDTYHNEEFIKDILSGFSLIPKKLFVSSEYRKTKHSGSLYDECLKDTKLKKHIGDNRFSDYHRAIKKNIEANLYIKSQPTRYEKAIYSNKKIPFEIRTVLSGVMKASRLQNYYDDNHLSVIHEISSNVIGPFLFIYVNWILKESIKLKIDTLYFIARDGQILFEIAKIIKKHLALNIELRYLYGSRKAWHLPAVTKIDSEFLDWAFDNTYFLSLDEVCKRAEIDTYEVNKILENKFLIHKNLNQHERELLKSEFENNKKIKDLILESAEKRRKIVLDYLKQEGFDNNKKIAIADVGWRGRQQKSLSKLLNLGGMYPKEGIVGFYISLLNEVKPLLNDRYFIFFEKYKFIDIPYANLYEKFVAADHGSCIGYNYEGNKIVPVLRPVRDNMIEWGLNVQQKSVLQFSENLLMALRKYNVNLNNESEVKISEILLRLLFKYPTKSEAVVLGKTQVCEDQEESKFYFLCEDINKKTLLRLLFFQNPLNHTVWIEGSIVKSFCENSSRLLLMIIRIKKFFMKIVKFVILSTKKWS